MGWLLRSTATPGKEKITWGSKLGTFCHRLIGGASLPVSSEAKWEAGQVNQQIGTEPLRSAKHCARHCEPVK